MNSLFIFYVIFLIIFLAFNFVVYRRVQKMRLPGDNFSLFANLYAALLIMFSLGSFLLYFLV